MSGHVSVIITFAMMLWIMWMMMDEEDDDRW